MTSPTSLNTANLQLRDRALALLTQGTGRPSAKFHKDQWEAIHELVSGWRRLLVVQRAGWGKSMVYFIATKLLRARGHGPTLLISPLLALMRDQLRAAERMGVAAQTVNSSNEEDWDWIEDAVGRGAVDLLLVSPERFSNDRFRSKVLAKIAGNVSLLVVDEAHCISDWGHDFRPQYRQLKNMLTQLPSNLRVLATTATANGRVMQDICEILGKDTEVKRGDLALPNISLQSMRVNDQAERMAWLATHLPNITGSGIVYALTKPDVDRVAGFLRSRGIDAHAYHGDVENESRQELEQKLIDNEVKVLVATTALGMGFDKPDLRFVVHFQSPGSPVAYYQQVGRAGRAESGARAILLRGTEDDDINDHFIKSAFPTKDEAAQVIDTLDCVQDGLTLPEIASRVNVPQGRIKKTLELLELESPSPVTKEGSNWFRLPGPRPAEIWDRIDRVTRLRREEQDAMRAFVKLESGHMGFMLTQLGSPEAPPWHADASPLPTCMSRTEIELAIKFLRRQSLPIEPRKRWPTGFKRSIDFKSSTIQHVNEPGLALSVYGDAGWGKLVKRGKYVDGRFGDELVDACAEMIQDAELTVAPKWVTNVPSRSGRLLVRDFAERLASKLRLDYVESMVRNGDPEEQKLMQNSAHQADNAWESLTVAPDVVRGGAVFLVDDIVDSRWTLTVAGYRLMDSGSGPVIPITLASASKTGNDS